MWKEKYISLKSVLSLKNIMQKAVNSYIFQNCFRKKNLELKRIVALSFKRLSNDVYISKKKYINTISVPLLMLKLLKELLCLNLEQIK